MTRLKLIGCLGRVSNVVVRIHPADEGGSARDRNYTLKSMTVGTGASNVEAASTDCIELLGNM